MNPQVEFQTPEAVLAEPRLARPAKIDLLRQWGYDQFEIAVAQDEGMQGPDPVFLDRILRVLARLGADSGLVRGTS